MSVPPPQKIPRARQPATSADPANDIADQNREKEVEKITAKSQSTAANEVEGLDASGNDMRQVGQTYEVT
jgi:hypothetical protein